MRWWLLNLAICVCLIAQGAAAQEVSEEARALFRDGVQLLKLPGGADYVGAYEKFKAAYADSPSPKILGNLGLCALKLERYGEAREAYEAYLSTAPQVTPAERTAITKDLAEMKATGSTLTLNISVAGAQVRDERTTRDGKLVVNAYSSSEPLFVKAGKHRIVVSAAGHKDVELELELGAETTSEHDVVLVKVVEESTVTVVSKDPDVVEDGGGVGVAFWVSLGITAGAGVAAGVMGGLTVSKHGQFDDARAAGDVAGAEELRDEGRTFSITTDVLLGVTGAAAIVTTILLITGLSDDGTSADARVRVTSQGLSVAF